MNKFFRYGSFAALCVFLQLALLITAIFLASTLPLMRLFLHILTIICVFVQLNSDISPAYKLCWAVFMLIFPSYGGIFFLLFSKRHSVNKIHRKMKPFFTENVPAQNVTPQKGIQTYLKNIGFPPVSCAEQRYFGTGEEFYAEMMKQIENAKKYILLEFFIVGDGKIWLQTEQLLAQKVREGVKVCLIIDDAGCLFTKPVGFEKRMTKLGIELHKFNPVTPCLTSRVGYRNHRKLVICDGKTAFCCGLNLSDEYMNVKEKYGHWKDSGVMVTGSGAAQFTQMFRNMWTYLSGGSTVSFISSFDCEQTQLVQPFSDTPLDNESVGLRAYLILINSAHESIRLTTPYLICSDEMLNTLCSAAMRGVKVQIITPHIPDKKAVFMLTRGFYSELMRAGIEIYEYAPGFIHAKSLLIDGETAVVGTINYDYRSMYLLFECGCVFYGGDVPRQLNEDFGQTLTQCIKIDRQKLPKSNIFVELARCFLYLFAPLV